jgi:hypothetical protein
MSEVLDRLQSLDSAEVLASFVREGMPGLHELYNAGWDTLCAEKEAINTFFLFKHSFIAKLDFDSQDNRAFLMICMDLAQRLNLLSSIPHIVRIINRQQICMNKRMSAGVSYLYPRLQTADDIIEKYSQVCSLLQDAVLTEEDDSKKCLVTFLNYYSAAVDHLSLEYAYQLKHLIKTSVECGEYPFLGEIEGLNDVNVSDPDLAHQQIQELIDAIIYESEIISRPIPVDEFIIEEGTQYSIDILDVPADFKSIKRISQERASRNAIVGRGVQQIKDEAGLFDYLRNYGNMHQAKVNSALVSPFPQEFNVPISIIDWGCGQGLASMVFMDKYGTDNIKQIILIEPSELALRRASLHCKKYAPNVPLQTICKEFDELTPEDIHLIAPETTIHLLSNVLDMERYSVEHLVNVMRSLPRSEQYYVCLSPHIDDIRTSKIDSFVRMLQQESTDFALLNSRTDTKRSEFWNCNNMNSGRSYQHGGSQYCQDFSGQPCSNRWTRVMRVFKA